MIFHVACRFPSAGDPPAPVRWIDRLMLEALPPPVATTDGVVPEAVAVSCPAMFPLESRRSIRPGTLVVLPGSSSQVQSTPKFRL